MIPVKMVVAAVSLAALVPLERRIPFFPGRRERLRHGLRNMGLSLINAVVIAAPAAGITAAVIAAAGQSRWSLLPAGSWPAEAVAFLLFDCWMYLWHRLNHRYRLLWRFHRAHHSDTEMDATTALRFHPGEIAISTGIRLPIYLLLGGAAAIVPAYEAALLAATLFHHSNIALPPGMDRFLRAVIVTPGMHRIHHSTLRAETDSNYSSIFAFWDRLFGSFRFRGNGSLTIGLEEYREDRWQTIPGMLMTPVRDAASVR